MKIANLIPVIGLSMGLFYASSKYQSHFPNFSANQETASSAQLAEVEFTEQESRGEELFKRNCSACHKIDKPMIGPPLAEAIEQWDGDKEGMYLWIRNWPKAIEAGYPRAIEVIDYDISAMNVYPTLSDEDLDALFAYVDAVSVD